MFEYNPNKSNESTKELVIRWAVVGVVTLAVFCAMYLSIGME